MLKLKLPFKLKLPLHLLGKGNQPEGSSPVAGEASSSGNAQAGTAADAPLANHQAVLNHFNRLMQSGHDSQAIQQQWQDYYSRLTEAEKNSVWQSVAAKREQTTPPAQPQSPVPAPAPTQPQSATPPPSQLQPPTPPPARSPENFLGAPLAIKGYASQPAAAEQSSRPGISEILPDKSLNHRTRDMLTWNSPTALFDKEETHSIWRQNIKSIIFGLTVGVICLAVWQFSFFNEQYIQPFIQPSNVSADSQIIITPGQSKISDASFKVIIPKIAVEAPIVSNIEGFRTITPNESEAAFEDRVQKALEVGTVHYPGSTFPGESGANFNSNFVVLGHSSSNIFAPGDFKSVFSDLEDLELDDLILINHNRTQYIYKIYGKKVVKPTEVSILQAGEYNNTLTLITCHPPGSSASRLVILAEQINPDPGNNRDLSENVPYADRETILPGKTQSLQDALRRR